MSLAKRPRGIPATEFDAASADVVNVATQTLHTLVDVDTIAEQMEAFEYNQATFTVRLTNLKDYQPLANGPVFRVLESRNKGSVMSLQVINGLDARMHAAYPNDPEMARLALRRILQPLGVAIQASEPLGESDDPDVGVIKSGTQTCEAYGAIAGMRACWDVPPLGGRDPRVGSVADGTNCVRQTLYTRPMNASLTGTTLTRALAHIIHNPQAWALAMGGYNASTNVWLNAAKARIDAAVFKGLLFAYLLVKSGKVTPSAELAGLGAEEFMEALSQHVGMINDYGATRQLAAAEQDSFKMLKVDFARLAFFVPTQDDKIVITDEYSYSFDPAAGRYSSRARTSDMRDLLAGTAAADIVHLQINANALEVAAFVEAVNEEERWAAGTFLTTSNVHGSNKAHLSLGVCS